VIYPSAMAVLDELGVDEASYSAGAEKISRFSFEFDGAFGAEMSVPRMWGRDYLYGVDRARFDAALWQNAGRYDAVTRREGFTVTELLRDEGGRVTGVVGAPRGGAEERITARCVVGADGRFSLVARKAGARVVEEEARCVSTVYFADWEGVAPFRDGFHGGHVHATGRGLDVLLFPMPDGRTSVNTHERADRVSVAGDPQGYYLATVRKLPAIARRLAGARQVSELRGVKRIGNGYREVAGPGWALVGDAAHYKDPVDGQGIYDALVGARALDAALAPWLAGDATWDAAAARYRSALMAETHDMYSETVTRLRRELYDEPPPLVVKTLVRWMMVDPTYQDRFLRYLGRAIPPKGWNGPTVVANAVLRGGWRDVRRAGPLSRLASAAIRAAPPKVDSFESVSMGETMKPRRASRAAPRTLASSPPPPLRAPRPASCEARFPSLAVALAGGVALPACQGPVCGAARDHHRARHPERGRASAGERDASHADPRPAPHHGRRRDLDGDARTSPGASHARHHAPHPSSARHHAPHVAPPRPQGGLMPVAPTPPPPPPEPSSPPDGSIARAGALPASLTRRPG